MSSIMFDLGFARKHGLENAMVYSYIDEMSSTIESPDMEVIKKDLSFIDEEQIIASVNLLKLKRYIDEVDGFYYTVK